MQHEYDFALSSADIDYLIQQAEVSKEWQIVANNTYADLIKAERRVKELEDKLYELNESAYETQIDFLEANGKKNSLLEQNQRHKQALEFYADEDNYEEDKFNMFAETPVVKYDKGQKARQALEGDKP